MRLKDYGKIKYVPYIDKDGFGPEPMHVPVVANLSDIDSYPRSRIWVGCEGPGSPGVLAFTVPQAKQLITMLTQAIGDVVVACPAAENGYPGDKDGDGVARQG